MKYKKAGPPITRRLVRVRRADFTLKYHEDFGIGNFSPERIEEDIWDSRDQERFQDSVVKSLEEYKSLVSALGPNTVPLERFASAVSSASFQGLDDGELAERVRAFARELGGEPLPVTVTAFIDGLSIDESPLAISDRSHLRRPTPEDTAECLVVDEHGGFKFPLGDTWFRVVGDFVFDAVYTGSAQVEFLRKVEALRLFRVGGVASNRYTIRSRHSFGGGTLSGGGRYSRFTYTLSRSDVVSLNTFLRDIVPLLPDPLHLDEGTTEREIAYTRYRDGLFQVGPSERAITSAITALEALFLKTEPELTRRLAQRVSVFLRVLGTQVDAQRTYENVSKGYKIRSIFIHGGSLKARDRPEADSLAAVLLEYARECALAFFQLATKKDDLLSQLDRAMIEPASVNDLVASLGAVVYR
jgi:hypothetical protein